MPGYAWSFPYFDFTINSSSSYFLWSRHSCFYFLNLSRTLTTQCLGTYYFLCLDSLFQISAWLISSLMGIPIPRNLLWLFTSLAPCSLILLYLFTWWIYIYVYIHTQTQNGFFLSLPTNKHLKALTLCCCWPILEVWCHTHRISYINICWKNEWMHITLGNWENTVIL